MAHQHNTGYSVPLMVECLSDLYILFLWMFVQISKVIGNVFPRIEVTLVSIDNNVHDQLKLKVWNEKRELVKTNQPGQLITIYAVCTGFFRNEKHVNTTDQYDELQCQAI